MSLTFEAVLSVVVVLAKSMRTDCGLDRRVDKSESNNLYLSRYLFVYLTTSLRLSPSGFVRVHRGVDVHRPEGYEFLGVRMYKLARSMKPDWKSVWFESVFAPFWLVPAGATEPFSVDLVFGIFADHMSSEYEARDLVCNGRMRNFRPSSRCSWATTLGGSLST